MATDPVCKMEVNEKHAPAQSEHKGMQYYFCSQQCQAKFDSNPERYTRAA